MNQRFGGGERAAEHPGDVLVGKFVLPAERYCDALVFRQFGQGLMDFLFQLLVQQRVGRRKAFRVFKPVSRPVSLFRMRSVE